MYPYFSTIIIYVPLFLHHYYFYNPISSPLLSMYPYFSTINILCPYIFTINIIMYYYFVAIHPEIVATKTRIKYLFLVKI